MMTLKRFHSIEIRFRSYILPGIIIEDEKKLKMFSYSDENILNIHNAQWKDTEQIRMITGHDSGF